MILAVTAFVSNTTGEILLIHSPLRQSWELPGGQAETQESAPDAVRRETWEETGYHVRPINIGCVHENRSKQILVLGFICEFLGGEASTSRESDEVRWCSISELSRLEMRPVMRLRVSDLLEFKGRVRYRAYVADPFVITRDLGCLS